MICILMCQSLCTWGRHAGAARWTSMWRCLQMWARTGWRALTTLRTTSGPSAPSSCALMTPPGSERSSTLMVGAAKCLSVRTAASRYDVQWQMQQYSFACCRAGRIANHATGVGLLLCQAAHDQILSMLQQEAACLILHAVCEKLHLSSPYCQASNIFQSSQHAVRFSCSPHRTSL